MSNEKYILKGTIIHTPTPSAFEIIEDGYLVCSNQTVEYLGESLPEKYQGERLIDYTGKLIIPGMADIHIHAPQYGFRGLGMELDPDSTWTTWFETYSLPEERRYADLEYADKAYDKLISDLLKTSTTRLCLFGTIHREATELLMKKLDAAGFAAFVGKLNMDRNSVEGLEETTEESLEETRQWLEETATLYDHVKPMITPRYIPSCTDACMEGLERLIREFRVPVQSHLSEALDEIEWVKSLKPEIDFYAQGYDMYHMLGDEVPSVMAHCVYPTDEEFALMTQRKNLWVAHCPQSIVHSTGFAAPIRRYLQAGVHVGLGSDMAGSNVLNMFRIIADTMLAGKVYWACKERGDDPYAKKTYITISEAFYLATKGGGSLWGNAGSFEEGFAFDAVVIDDTSLADFNKRTARQRIERVIQLADDRNIVAKYIGGKQVL